MEVDDAPWEEEDDDRDDGPTMAGSNEGLFGLDDAAARAASLGPALGAPAQRPQPAPTAKPPFEAGPPQPPPGVDNEMATVAVPKDDLDRARKQAQAEPTADESDVVLEDHDESTRAVPRDELLRGQDAQLIIGNDAVGEEATLAVAPGNNEANSKHYAALAQTMLSEGGFPPPPGGAPQGVPQGAGPHGMAPPQWNDPNQGWPNMPMPGMGMQGTGPHAPSMPGSNPHMPASNPHMQGSNPHMQGSNPHMQGSNPHMQGSNPHMQGSNPQLMAAHGMHMPGQMSGMGQITGAGPHPMMSGPGGPMQAPAQMAQGQQRVQQPTVITTKRSKISGQMLLLAIVGVICLAIFITGIVLFATTKF